MIVDLNPVRTGLVQGPEELIPKIKYHSTIDSSLLSDVFFSNKLYEKWKHVCSPIVTDFYFYYENHHVIAFVSILKENLKFGFMHYHLPDNARDKFCQSYPEFNQMTEQIHYIYTEPSFRKKGIATNLLNFVENDLKNKGVVYLWLKKETTSNIYKNQGYMDFPSTIEEILINPILFYRELYDSTKINRESIISHHGDCRLVKRIC